VESVVGEVEREVRMLRREVCHLDCIDVIFLTSPSELLKTWVGEILQ
jgi:hypothetical protein